MSSARELADRLKKCPACPFGGAPSSLKFIAGFAMTEKDRDLIVTALLSWAHVPAPLPPLADADHGCNNAGDEQEAHQPI